MGIRQVDELKKKSCERGNGEKSGEAGLGSSTRGLGKLVYGFPKINERFSVKREKIFC
jgi:hypothetical protein